MQLAVEKPVKVHLSRVWSLGFIPCTVGGFTAIAADGGVHHVRRICWWMLVRLINPLARLRFRWRAIRPQGCCCLCGAFLLGLDGKASAVR